MLYPLHSVFRGCASAVVLSVMAAGLSLSACRSGSDAATVTPPPPPPPMNPPVTPVPPVTPPTIDDGKRDRYAYNNKCVVLRANVSNNYIAASGTGYAASASNMADAEPFFLKPTGLGDYALHNRAGQLMNGAATVGNVAITAATDSAIFHLHVDGDSTSYPPAPQYDVAPSKVLIDSYRDFKDPLLRGTVFTFTQALNGQRLTAPDSSALTVTAGDTPNQRFRLEEVTGCTAYPEASDNTEGETFKGTTEDGRVLGMADVHVHTSSSTFLGGALTGKVFDKFGVLRAMPACTAQHGPMGATDFIGAAFVGDTNGHSNTGWPTHPEWPSRDSLSHRAIYWKWIERAWKGGLRIMVNDVVENATLCELQRSASGNPAVSCNEMDSARRQIGTMYALQDYIDAQFGGRGKGFLQIVLTPAEARAKVTDGKLAVVLGIEVSNLFNCQLNYSPLRTQQPFEETGEGGTENSYGCTMTETGAPNEILTQLKEVKDLGIRQLITIHEFDNAFGGNGIFNDLILNAGNRENSGGIPFGSPAGPFTPTGETPTGEFWTTYDCPEEEVTPGFSGYLWGSAGGAVMTNLGPPAPLCPFVGQGGRPGGTLACYPAKAQCNARWLTPIGLYTYQKLMEQGIIFDIDHLEYEMKSQALELAEAQDPPYPFVSTHGTFGGTSNDQAARILKNGGHLYPSIGSTRGFIGDMMETKALSDLAENSHLFGFGFGTDTDGLSGQMGPRGDIEAGKELVYPFVLFKGAPFDALPDFAKATAVTFKQPEERDNSGAGRTWHQDLDGNAHYGMMADMVQEMRLEGSPQQMQMLFNAAEVYLQTWERTEASSRAINAKGIVTPAGILRAAPVPASPLPFP